MKRLITSPLHSVLGSNLAVITVTGRKSGKLISTPVNVTFDGQTYTVISMRQRTWWRNLRDKPAAQLHVGGKQLEVQGAVIESADAVSQSLQSYFERNPKTVKYFGAKLNSDGRVEPSDLQRLANERVVIQLRP
jgi:deazaflavin-dependent oxidoreductase (nitroreductase family)